MKKLQGGFIKDVGFFSRQNEQLAKVVSKKNIITTNQHDRRLSYGKKGVTAVDQ